MKLPVWTNFAIPAGAAKRRLLVGTFLTPVLFFSVVGSSDIERALAAVIRDPLAVLGARSPGDRPAGALTQTKQRRKASRTIPLVGKEPGGGPVERVLSATRTRPELPYVPGLTGPDVASNIPGLVDAPTGITGGVPVGSGGGIPIVPIGIGGGPGGGGALPSPTPTPAPTSEPTPTPTSIPTPTPTSFPTPTPTPPPATTPVPEPATWLTMIAGLALAGGMLRRRPRRGFVVGSPLITDD